MKKYLNRFFNNTDKMNTTQKVFASVIVFVVSLPVSWFIIELLDEFDLDFWSDDEIAFIVLSALLTAVVGLRIFRDNS